MIYRFDDCALDPERRELRRAGAVLPIEPQVFDLLEFLIRNRQRVVSRDAIFAAVWHGRIVSDSVLSTRINALRRAIGDNGATQRLIRTHRRKGIRFVGAVREQDIASKEQPAETMASGRSATRRLTSVVTGAPAILVLPFTNLGGDLKFGGFAEGLTEEIITALSKLDWILVISRYSSFAFKGKTTLRDIASQLGVQYVLQGSVRTADGHARVAVQLVDGISDHLLWAECYDRDVSDLLGVQTEVMAKVLCIVGEEIFAAESKRTQLKSHADLSAWDCMVKALTLMNTRKKQDARAAHVLLQRAISINPKCAPAHSLLSFLTTLTVHLGWQSRNGAQPIALHSAKKALALDQDEPWAHVALGYATLQVCNRPEDAIESLQYGLTLDPNLSIAHYLIALSSAYAADCESAFRHADMSEQLVSRDLLARGNAGAHNIVRATTCFVAARYQQGIQFARKALGQNARLIPAYRQLVTNYAFAGEIEQATMALQSLRRSSPAVGRWLKESSTTWSRADDYKKYAEAFCIAGFK